MNWIKNRKTQIEGLWCVLAGFCFTVLARVLQNGSPDYRFNWEIDIWFMRSWWNHDEFETNAGNFIFGFVVTLILIWSIKSYRRLP
jgi:hypothetical protein